MTNGTKNEIAISIIKQIKFKHQKLQEMIADLDDVFDENGNLNLNRFLGTITVITACTQDLLTNGETGFAIAKMMGEK